MTDHETAGGMSGEFAMVRALVAKGKLVAPHEVQPLLDHIDFQAAELSRVSGELEEARGAVARLEEMLAETRRAGLLL